MTAFQIVVYCFAGVGAFIALMAVLLGISEVVEGIQRRKGWRIRELEKQLESLRHSLEQCNEDNENLRDELEDVRDARALDLRRDVDRRNAAAETAKKPARKRSKK